MFWVIKTVRSTISRLSFRRSLRCEDADLECSKPEAKPWAYRWYRTSSTGIVKREVPGDIGKSKSARHCQPKKVRLRQARNMHRSRWQIAPYPWANDAIALVKKTELSNRDEYPSSVPHQNSVVMNVAAEQQHPWCSGWKCPPNGTGTRLQKFYRKGR